MELKWKLRDCAKKWLASRNHHYFKIIIILDYNGCYCLWVPYNFGVWADADMETTPIFYFIPPMAVERLLLVKEQITGKVSSFWKMKNRQFYVYYSISIVCWHEAPKISQGFGLCPDIEVEGWIEAQTWQQQQRNS